MRSSSVVFFSKVVCVLKDDIKYFPAGQLWAAVDRKYSRKMGKEIGEKLKGKKSICKWQTENSPFSPWVNILQYEKGVMSKEAIR
jgi:hypothetical protein